jgi:hypothetical protein
MASALQESDLVPAKKFRTIAIVTIVVTTGLLAVFLVMATPLIEHKWVRNDAQGEVKDGDLASIFRDFGLGYILPAGALWISIWRIQGWGKDSQEVFIRWQAWTAVGIVIVFSLLILAFTVDSVCFESFKFPVAGESAFAYPCEKQCVARIQPVYVYIGPIYTGAIAYLLLSKKPPKPKASNPEHPVAKKA